MSTLSIERFSVETNTRGIPLFAVGKRYRHSQHQASESPGLALLFAHGTGFHKEIWEPTIESLFEADRQHIVAEVWAVDCQNHGESAVVNEKKLFDNPQLIDIWEYANALAAFRQQLIHQDNVVIIAHSAGTVAGVLATMFFNPPDKIPFSSVILVEPPIFAKDKYLIHKTPMYAAVAEMTPLRRDVWASFETAKTWLQRRPPWSSWAEEVLEKYVTYGLRALPTLYYPGKQGVTLTCTKVDEAQAYAAGNEDFDALWRLNQICGKVPVHIIWAEVNDLFSKELKDSITDSAQGRIFASITSIAESGHMIPQERPAPLGRSILAIVHGVANTLYKL